MRIRSALGAISMTVPVSCCRSMGSRLFSRSCSRHTRSNSASELFSRRSPVWPASWGCSSWLEGSRLPPAAAPMPAPMLAPIAKPPRAALGTSSSTPMDSSARRIARFSDACCPASWGISSNMPSPAAPRKAAPKRDVGPPIMMPAKTRSPIPPKAPVITPEVINAWLEASSANVSRACSNVKPPSDIKLWIAADSRSCSSGMPRMESRTSREEAPPPSKPSLKPPASVAVVAARLAASLGATPRAMFQT